MIMTTEDTLIEHLVKKHNLVMDPYKTFGEHWGKPKDKPKVFWYPHKVMGIVYVAECDQTGRNVNCDYRFMVCLVRGERWNSVLVSYEFLRMENLLEILVAQLLKRMYPNYLIGNDTRFALNS